MKTLADIILGGKDTGWLDDAACHECEIEDFFVNAGNTIDPKILNLCRGCPVREDCLKHAYSSEPPLVSSGYYGGMSPGDRKRFNFEEALNVIRKDSANYFEQRKLL